MPPASVGHVVIATRTFVSDVHTLLAVGIGAANAVPVIQVSRQPKANGEHMVIRVAVAAGDRAVCRWLHPL